MITVPQSTIEKPLTAIDYIAALQGCNSVDDVQQFSERLPIEILNDDRYSRAMAMRLALIHGKKAA